MPGVASLTRRTASREGAPVASHQVSWACTGPAGPGAGSSGTHVATLIPPASGRTGTATGWMWQSPGYNRVTATSIRTGSEFKPLTLSRRPAGPAGPARPGPAGPARPGRTGSPVPPSCRSCPSRPSQSTPMPVALIAPVGLTDISGHALFVRVEMWMKRALWRIGRWFTAPFLPRGSLLPRRR